MLAAASATVYVAPPAWGVPTSEPASLAALVRQRTWLRMQGVPHAVRACDSALGAPNEELPYVGLADGRVVAGPDVLKALARAGVTPTTTELSATQQADAAAYLALLHHTLRPAWLYTLWYDPDNYARVARPLSGARLPFPLSYAVPWTARAHVTDALTRDRPVLDRDEVLDRAAEAVAALAELVADRPYCLGDRPTPLDAWLYGYLAVIVHAPLPGSELSQLVRSYGPLVRFVRRVQQTWFAGGVA